MINKIKWDDLYIQDKNRRKYKENFDWIKPYEIQKVGDAYWFKSGDGMLYYLYTTERNQKGEAVSWYKDWAEHLNDYGCDAVYTVHPMGLFYKKDGEWVRYEV